MGSRGNRGASQGGSAERKLPNVCYLKSLGMDGCAQVVENLKRQTSMPGGNLHAHLLGSGTRGRDWRDEAVSNHVPTKPSLWHVDGTFTQGGGRGSGEQWGIPGTLLRA